MNYKWFEIQVEERWISVIRFSLGILFIWMCWDLYPVLHLLYGKQGILGDFGNLPETLLDFKDPRNFLFYFSSPHLLEFLFWCEVICAILLILGYAPSVALVAYVLIQWLFESRNPDASYGVDAVIQALSPWLLILFFKKSPVWLKGVAVRGVQLQVAYIYFLAGLFKLANTKWQQGEALGLILKSEDFGSGIELIRNLPDWLNRGLNYSTLAIELGCPFFLFFRRTRTFALLTLVLMHIGIDLMMSVRFFSLIMCIGLLAFHPTRHQPKAP